MSTSATSIRTMRIRNIQRWLIVILSFILFVSAISLVVTLHYSRFYFAQLQLVEKDRDDLYIDWTKLLLEQGMASSDRKIETTAAEKLHMHIPDMKEINMVQP